jgi:chemotaxis protein MotB
MSRRWIGLVAVLAAFSLAGCASDWQERYEQSQRENLDLVQQMEELRGSQATDAAKVEGISAQMKAMEREQAKLLEERNLAARSAEEWKRRAESGPTAAGTGAPVNPQARDLAAEARKIYGDRVTVTPEGNVEITLASDLTFASGSDVLNDGAKKALRQLASKLNGEFAPYMIRVEGHTDNEPVVRTKAKYQDNLGLSTARANSVARFMKDDMRIDASRIMTSGRGEQEPIADNKSSAGKAKNRRVEIVVFTSASAK